MAVSVERKPFAVHLDELRSRIMSSVVWLLIASTIGYLISDELLAIISAPLGLPLYYTSPGGGFSLLIQLCLGFGLVISIPVIVFHIIRFLAPIFPSYTTKLLVTILTTSVVLIVCGIAFAYFISLPAALYFLNGFSNEQVSALITTETYMSFVTLYLAGFALLFQLPLIMLLINKTNPLKPTTMIRQMRWVVLFAFVLAAVLTPTPDPFNQFIMASPIVGLYGLSVGCVGAMNVTSRRKKATFCRSNSEPSASRVLPSLFVED